MNITAKDILSLLSVKHGNTVIKTEYNDLDIVCTNVEIEILRESYGNDTDGNRGEIRSTINKIYFEDEDIKVFYYKDNKKLSRSPSFYELPIFKELIIQKVEEYEF